MRNNPFISSSMAISGYLFLSVALLLNGCVVSPVENSSSVAATTVDPASKGPVSGVGIEGQDIIAMTDQMMRDMLSTPSLVERKTPPRIIIDSENFKNSGSQPINRDTITNRLRVNLNRAAQGRMVFVSRKHAATVEHERDLKRKGVTDVGTAGLTKAVAGVDFRITGEITNVDSRNSRTGMMQRYNQIVFEMLDLESGVLVWSGIYEFARAGSDDIIYR